MAVTVFKTYSAGEVLSASDLNSSFSRLHDNGEDLGWPATKAKDLDGQELILDSDADTSITASTDDRIDIRIAGTDSMFIGHATGNTAGFLHIDPLAHTVTASTNYALCRIGNANAITVPAGTTTIAAGLSIGIPNWTATGTITNSATLYIEGPATEGSTDYALWVDAGAVRFDDTIELGNATDTTLARASAGNVNIEGNIIYRASGTDVPVTDGGTGSSTASAARTALGLAIGSDVQAFDADTAKTDVAQEYTATQNFNETALTSTSNAMAWDTAPNQVATHTLTENTTVGAPTNQKAGAFYSLKIVQHASAAKTVAYNAVFKFEGSTTPTMSTGVNDIDVMTFRSDGTNMHMVGIVQDSS